MERERERKKNLQWCTLRTAPLSAMFKAIHLKLHSAYCKWLKTGAGNQAREEETISSFMRDKRKSVCMSAWGYSPPQNRGWENLVRDYDWFHLQHHPRSQSASSQWDSSTQNITHLTFGSDTAPLTSVVRSDYTAKPLSEVNKLLCIPISIFMFVWLSNTLGPVNLACNVNFLVYNCKQG